MRPVWERIAACPAIRGYDAAVSRYCWANVPRGGYVDQCRARVDEDVDHVGLCRDCHERLRS